MKNIINNETNCNLFGILKDNRRDGVISYFTEIVLNMRKYSFKLCKEMAILIKCVEKKWNKNRIIENKILLEDNNSNTTKSPQFDEIAQILGLIRKKS